MNLENDFPISSSKHTKMTSTYPKTNVYMLYTRIMADFEKGAPENPKGDSVTMFEVISAYVQARSANISSFVAL